MHIYRTKYVHMLSQRIELKTQAIVFSVHCLYVAGNSDVSPKVAESGCVRCRQALRQRVYCRVSCLVVDGRSYIITLHEHDGVLI